MTTTKELLGLIKGLGEAVKDQLKAHSESQAELQQLNAAIGNLVESSSNSLRICATKLVLRKYKSNHLFKRDGQMKI